MSFVHILGRRRFCCPLVLPSFFFSESATTDIYTLSLHDALPIFPLLAPGGRPRASLRHAARGRRRLARGDRKSTRLNSSHQIISYAVFCLKKKTSPSPQSTPARDPQRYEAAATGHCQGKFRSYPR